MQHTSNSEVLWSQPPLFCSFCRKPELSISTRLNNNNNNNNQQQKQQQQQTFKVVQCTRCRLKHYCSTNCESRDYGSHAGFCLHIERMRKHYETYPSHPLGVLSHQMGNLMFHVAYRTMDTFQHEAHIFQEALYYFLEAYTKYKESGRPVYNLEDQILLIYAALGHDALACAEIFRSLAMQSPSQSLSTNNKTHSEEFEPSSEFADLLTILPDAPWRTSHLAILLLLKLRLLCRLRTLENRFSIFQTTNGGVHLEQVHSVVYTILIGRADAIVEQERQILRLVHRLSPSLIEVIYRTRPMTHTDAPTLFHVLVPTECWQILQDCFRMTPELESIANELFFATPSSS